MCGATAPRGTGGRRTTRARACATGPRPSPPGASGTSPRRRRACCPLTCRAGTPSSWAAAPATCRPGWPAAARGRPLDNSAAQLATARQLQDRFGLRFPLIHASAEQAPFADASFDVAISEYGASIWCDPYAWIPEAARLLRPGGQLIFLVNSALLMLTMPDTDGLPAAEQLLRPHFGMHRFEWPGDESVEFHLGHGDMIRLLRGCGLEVEDLLELRPDPDARTRVPLRDPRMVPAMAMRRSLEGPQIALRITRVGVRTAGLAVVCWQDGWSKWGWPLPGYGPRRVAQLARQHSHVAHRRGTG